MYMFVAYLLFNNCFSWTLEPGRLEREDLGNLLDPPPPVVLSQSQNRRTLGLGISEASLINSPMHDLMSVVFELHTSNYYLHNP